MLRRGWMAGMIAVALTAGATGYCQAQVPNGSFEEGEKFPKGWVIKGGMGTWENTGHTGKRCVSLTGDGTTSPRWQSDCFPLDPDKFYRLSAWMKAPSPIAVCFGTSAIYWSFIVSNTEWERLEFVFQTPGKPQSPYVRFWSWHHRAKLFLDDIAISEVTPVHSKRDGIELGVAERIKDNVYTTGPIFPKTLGVAGPGSRFLFRPQEYGYNGNRWFVNPDGVVLRHNVGDVEQTGAALKFSSGWNPRGKVTVLASNDGKNFEQIYETRKLYWTDPIVLPAKLFPAKEIYIWFRCVEMPEDKGKPDALTFELVGYEYKAKLAKPVPDLDGKTELVDVAR